MPDKEEAKRNRELAIFARFISKSGLDIAPESVQSREPPEPDIYCVEKTLGPLRFELTEACAPEFAKAIHNPPETGVAAMFGEDVTKETILKKLSKRYQGTEPVDLLIYTDGATAKPDFLLRYDVEDALKVTNCFFRMVWLMGDEVHCIDPGQV